MSTGAAMINSKPSMAKSSSSVVSKRQQMQEYEEERVSRLFSIMSRNKTMPVTRAEHEAIIPEWKLHCLCTELGMLSHIRGQLGGFF